MKLPTYALRKGNEGWEKLLFAPLREQAGEPAIQRVDDILSLLVAADTHLREQLDYLRRCDPAGVAELLHLYERSKEAERAYYQTLELLNIKLSTYRWTATLAGDLDGFRSAIVPVQHDGNSEYSGRKHFDYTEIREYSEYTEAFVAQRDQLLAQMGKPTRPERAPANWNFMEMRMVSYLLEALDKGEISRFRRCSECQQWFYAIRGHQHFCGDVCRRKHEAQSPAFKERRAAYMREKYRPREKRKDAIGKRQARQVLSEKSKKGGK